MVMIATIRRPGLAQPTLLSMSGDATLSASAMYEVLVTTDTSRQLTISAGKAHLVRNVGSNNLVLVLSGASNVTLTPDTEARVSWDVSGSAHKVAEIGAKPDSAMSATSPNAVENNVVKTYVDALLASTVNTLGNQSGAVGLNFSGTNAKIQTLTATGDVTLSFTDPDEACWITVVVSQDATGGWRLTWPTLADEAPPLDPAASSTTVFHLFFDGTNYHV